MSEDAERAATGAAVQTGLAAWRRSALAIMVWVGARVLTILTCNVVKKGRGEGVGGRAEVGSKWMRGDNNVQHYAHRHIRCTDKPYTAR